MSRRLSYFNKPLWVLVPGVGLASLVCVGRASAEWARVPSPVREEPSVGEPERVAPPEEPSLAPPIPEGGAVPGKGDVSDQVEKDVEESADVEDDSSDPTTSTSEVAPPESLLSDEEPAPSDIPPVLVPQADGQVTVRPPASSRPVEAAEGPTVAEERPPCAPVAKSFHSMFLLEGLARYGGFVEGENLEDEDSPTNSYRAGNVGAQATVGLMPGGKTFLLAGRLYGGAYLGSEITSGTIGASVLFGANLGRQPSGRTFSYVMGGFGVEYIPGKRQDLLTLQVSGGAVLGGIDFGADVIVGGNDEFALFMLGMHMGWGQLF